MIQGFGGSSNNRNITLQLSGLCLSGHHTSQLLKVSGGALIRKVLKAGSIETKHLTVTEDLDVGGDITSGGTVTTKSVYISDPIEDDTQATSKEYVDKFRFIGDVKYSILDEDHEGWLICDGRSLRRSFYPNLFAVMGVQFGFVDSEHFNLPDCRGRVLGASGDGPGLSSRSVGDSVGEEQTNLSVSQLPSHTHTGTTNNGGEHSHGITDPGHRHSQTTINDDFNNSGDNPPGFTADSAGSRTWNNINSSTTGITINNGGTHQHTFETNSTGDGNAVNIMQPTLFIGNLFVFSGESVPG